MKSHIKTENNNINAISKKANFIINIILIIYCIICIVPILLVLSVSLSDELKVLQDGFKLIPEKFSLYAYTYLLSDPSKILRSYGITILVTVIGTALGIIVTALYAYPISRKSFKQRGVFSFILFFTMLFSGGLVPWYMVYTNLLHMKNTVWVLIIPYLISPMNILIMRTFFSTNIPDSILESAKIDGANEMRIFTSIVLPLSKPVLATIGLFYTLAYWNDWWLSMVYISEKKLANLQYIMYIALRNVEYLSSASMSQTSAASQVSTLPTLTMQMAMCIIGIGPIIFAYPYFQKYFVKGLTIGAIKG